MELWVLWEGYESLTRKLVCAWETERNMNSPELSWLDGRGEIQPFGIVD